MKNLHHFPPQQEREHRYPFLGALDLLVNLTLSLATLALTIVALIMAIESVWPGFVSLPRF